MIRATTPTHTFTFPENISSYSIILITYTQNNKIILEKQKSDLEVYQSNLKKGYYTLSQNETNKFDKSGTISIQVRVKDANNNTVLASNIVNVAIKNVLDDKEL